VPTKIAVAIRRSVSDAFLRLGSVQGLADLFKARRAQVPHRRGAFEIPEMLDQRAPRHGRGGDDFGQPDRRTEVRLDVIDCPLDVARCGRPFQPLQSFAVIMRLMQQQRGCHEFAE